MTGDLDKGGYREPLKGVEGRSGAEGNHKASGKGSSKGPMREQREWAAPQDVGLTQTTNSNPTAGELEHRVEPGVRLATQGCGEGGHRARSVPVVSWGKDVMANDPQVSVNALSQSCSCIDACSCSVLSLLFLLQAVHGGQGEVCSCCVLGKGRDGGRPPDPHALLDLPASHVGVGKLRDCTQRKLLVWKLPLVSTGA